MATNHALTNSPKERSVHFMPNSDHLYLSPKFYEKNNDDHPVTNGKFANNKESNLSARILNGCRKGRPISHCVSFKNKPSKTSPFDLALDESIYSPILKLDESANEAHKHSNSSSVEDEDEFDEDSNDDKSCSSSSGCSSSSNSMAGSVNRHLSLKSSQYQGNLSKNEITSNNINSSNYNKDLGPKQVKRRFDWDSTSDVQPVVSQTMTAFNGKKNISIRTFKLTNAMKQSLVAAGCNTVAVAAVTANLQNLQNSSNHGDKSSYAANGNTMTVSPIVNHQSPTAFAIVNNKSPNSYNIVSSNNLSNRTLPTSTSTSSNQVVFKTPLAPKSSTETSNPIYIVKGDNNLLESKISINSNQTELRPILAGSALTNFSVRNGSTSKKGVSTVSNNKKARLSRDYDCTNPEPILKEKLEYSNFLDQSSIHTPKTNGVFSPDYTFYSPPFNDTNEMPSGSRSTSSSSASSPLYEPSSYNGKQSAINSASRTRYETSLGQLTRKFISLLQDSPDGSINLNDASTILQVQKRRIYDITNVLEGVGLLHKTFKNNIQWRGGLHEYFGGKSEKVTLEDKSYRNRKPPPLSLLFSEKQKSEARTVDPMTAYEILTNELSELENDENRLDNLLNLVNADSSRIKSECEDLLYVTYMDLHRIPEFSQQTVIGIRPPMDTTLEVPNPSESLQIWLKNGSGRMIEVYLCPKSDNDKTSKFNVKVADHNFGEAIVKEELEGEVSIKDEEEYQSSITPLNKTAESDSGFSSAASLSIKELSKSSSYDKMINPNASSNASSSMAELEDVASSPSYDISDSLLSSSSIYDDLDRNIQNEPGHSFNRNSSELSSQLDDDFNLLDPNLNYEDERYRMLSNRMLLPFEHSPISSLISLELSATDEYDFALCDNEGIADLFDSTYD